MAKHVDEAVWNRFIQRYLLYFMLPNMVFNSLIPYLSFKDPNAVHLFQGEFCFARFLLPMALLLPFIITFDVIKRSMTMAGQGKLDLVFPEGFPKNRFMFRMAGINGLLSLSIVLLVMLIVQLNLPAAYTFEGKILAVILGLLAGTLTLIFTILPVQKLKKMVSKPEQVITQP